MELQEMRSNIRYAVGLREPEEQAMIDQEIHRGILDVLRRTSCFVQCIIADVPDNKSRIEFAAPGGVMKVLHILRGNIVMDRTLYPPLPGTFAQAGQILFFTDQFAVGEQLQMYAVPRVAKMTVDTNKIEDEQWGGIPEEHQDAVELYACSKLASRADDQTSSMGANYWILYVGQDGLGGRISEIKRQVNRMSGMTLGPARLRMAPGGMTAGYGNGNGNGISRIGVIGPNNNNFENAISQLLSITNPETRASIIDIWNNSE